MNPILRLIGEAEDFSEYADILALDAEQEKTLFNREPRKTAEEAFKEAFNLHRNNQKAPDDLIEIIAKDATRARFYATGGLKGRFPLGEPAIAKSPLDAYGYAEDVLKTSWLAAPGVSYSVAKLATDTILKSAYAQEYAGFLKGLVNAEQT